jgi:hypothetical protein
MENCGMAVFVSGWGPVLACCEHGNESLGSVRGGEFHN